MNIVNKIALRNLRQNRQRTAMTILGATLSFALILTVIFMTASFKDSLVNSFIATHGIAHAAFEEIPGNKIGLIESEPSVEVLYFSKPFTKERVGEENYKHYTEYAPVSLYPLDAYDKIETLDAKARVGSELYNVFIRYRDTSINGVDMANRLIRHKLNDAGIDELSIRTDYDLLNAQGHIDETSKLLMACLAVLVLGFLSIAAIFFIRNSFTISATERIRDFGVLASIGARPRQIRRSVFFEAYYVALFAIPLSVGLSILGTLVLIFATNHFIGDALGYNVSLSLSWQGIVVTAILGLVILILAASSAATLAGHCSPIMALRNTNEIKIKAKKVHTSAIVAKIWGIGGVLASKNLKRSRGKYRTTVVSIVVSVTLFVGMGSFVQYIQKALDEISSQIAANVTISGILSPKDFRKMATTLGLRDFEYFGEVSVWMDDSIENEPKIITVSREAFERYAKKAGYDGSDYSNLAILNNHISDSTGERFGYKVKSGDVITLPIIDPSFYTDVIEMNESEMNEGEISTDDYVRKTKMTIGLVTDQPVIEGDLLSNFNVIFISEDHPVAKRYSVSAGQNVALQYLIMDEGRSSDIDSYIATKFSQKADLIDVMDMEKINQSTKNLLYLAEFFIYGFVAVLAIIGATNIFNTITTNMASRATEFAVLRSVGMTKKEFNNMIRLESFFYSFRALFIGIACGLGVTLLIRRMFWSADGAGVEFIVPWWPILISVVIVLIMVLFVMRFSIRQIDKKNIIETIRSTGY